MLHPIPRWAGDLELRWFHRGAGRPSGSMAVNGGQWRSMAVNGRWFWGLTRKVFAHLTTVVVRGSLDSPFRGNEENRGEKRTMWVINKTTGIYNPREDDGVGGMLNFSHASAGDRDIIETKIAV